ncbi:Anaphase-promoting complex subunit 2 [Dimargaris verticillata]|uniref:Anaphase-promoting complex subunit 2 n=1 Tax=Dimargaris verticillata TaxID=2761393 RepID=A0A9W8B0Z0_9FUNG|nr:Anaphase-promoting complex subunit 2 [Dimargaris verticillata]
MAVWSPADTAAQDEFLDRSHRQWLDIVAEHPPTAGDSVWDDYFATWTQLLAHLHRQHLTYLTQLGTTTPTRYDTVERESQLYLQLPASFLPALGQYFQSCYVAWHHAEQLNLDPAATVAHLVAYLLHHPSAPAGTWATAYIAHCATENPLPTDTRSEVCSASTWGELPSWMQNVGSLQAWLNDLSKHRYLELLSQFAQSAQILAQVGIAQLGQDTLYALLHRIIKHQVQAQCRDQFDQPLLVPLCTWLRNQVLPWVTLMAAPKSTDCSSFWQPSLLHHLYTAFSDQRVGELFDIIVEYPDSQPALADLKACVDKLGNRMMVAHTLKREMERRLLQQGANTSDILAQYVSCVKSLRYLDPTSVMAQYVTGPIRAYLRTREDAIRCIVASLVSDQDGLLDVNVAPGPCTVDSDDEEYDYGNEHWEPAPMEALALPKTSVQRNADIISMLITIYDTKQVLVREFQRSLADKLLTFTDYATDDAVRDVELLKLRLGEDSLGTCEVMVKDVADSKRLDQHILAPSTDSAQPLVPLPHAYVLSHVFWPAVRNEPLKLPASMEQALTQYAQQFETLRPGRKLHWYRPLGRVELEVALADRTLSLTVTPFQAAVLHHFVAQSTWAPDALACQLDVSVDSLRGRLLFWVAQGVLCETPDQHYQLAEKPGHSAQASRQDDTDDSDEDMPADYIPEGLQAASAMPSEADRRAEEMRVYWSFVVGMLTNLGALPLDRIQAMLGMFVQEPATYNRTEAELKEFLALMVREDKLELSGGQYKLK